MNVKVQQEGKTENICLDEGATAETLLDCIGLLPDAYIVLKGKVPVPIDYILNDGDSIKLIKVASGG